MHDVLHLLCDERCSFQCFRMHEIRKGFRRGIRRPAGSLFLRCFAVDKCVKGRVHLGLMFRISPRTIKFRARNEVWENFFHRESIGHNMRRRIRNYESYVYREPLGNMPAFARYERESTPHNQIQEASLPAQIVPGSWWLAFDVRVSRFCLGFGVSVGLCRQRGVLISGLASRVSVRASRFRLLVLGG